MNRRRTKKFHENHPNHSKLDRIRSSNIAGRKVFAIKHVPKYDVEKLFRAGLIEVSRQGQLKLSDKGVTSLRKSRKKLKELTKAAEASRLRKEKRGRERQIERNKLLP